MLTAPVPPPSDAPALTVSIVIPAFDEAARIERCLEAAVSQTLRAAEIIVVDNRSSDDTVRVVDAVARRHPDAGIRVISQADEQGITATRNTGFDAAVGDVIGRIDADTIIAPDWVARVSAAMTARPLAALSGPVSYYDLPVSGLGKISDDGARRFLRSLGRRYPFLLGSNMAVRRSAWQRVAPHTCADHADEMHEDLDLAVHLHDLGQEIGYDPRVRARVSARRLSGSPASFRSYLARFERTYEAHGIDLWHVRAPRMLLASLYRWMRVLRSLAPSVQPAVAA